MVGTCKTNRGVMSRSNGYSWVGVIPGDLHTKGYFVESYFKEQGLGGFYYLVSKVLKRPKLTSDALKKRNLLREIWIVSGKQCLMEQERTA